VRACFHVTEQVGHDSKAIVAIRGPVYTQGMQRLALTTSCFPAYWRIKANDD
jgi:hypothetical protein